METRSRKHDLSTLNRYYKTSKSLINDLIRFSRENEAVFRGISSTEQLKPVINRVRSHSNKWRSTNLKKYEFELLNDFKRNASSMLNGYLDTLDIVAYAQHFGLATRLIDWTRDPLAALYFAICRTKPEDGNYRIYYTHLDYHTLISKSYSGQTHYDLANGYDFIVDYIGFINSIENANNNSGSNRSLKDAINDRIMIFGDKVTTTDIYRDNSLVFFESNASNPRLIAQKGLFSIPVSIEGNRAKEEIERNCNYVSLDFTEDERIQTLEFLENMNYSALRLFPDIQNIAVSITDKHVINHDRNSKSIK